MTALIKKMAQAIMISDGCGYTLDGERAFCDDTRLEEGERQRSCACKVSAKVALAVAITHYSDQANVTDAMAIAFWKAHHGEWDGTETNRAIAAAMKAA